MAETAAAFAGGSGVADGTVPETPPARGATRAELIHWLYQRHHKRVFHLALRYGCGDRGFAEDVVQDVFVRLLQVWDRLRENDDLGAWLYRVTANRSLNKLRNERVRAVLRLRFLRDDDVYEGRQDLLVDAARKHRALFAAIRTLPPKERVALCMFRLDGISQDEIGVVLGHGKSAVCKIIQRAESRLRAAGWEVDGV